MKESLDSFLTQLPNLNGKKPSELVEYFIYFLTIIKGQDVARPSDVGRCFEISRLPKYSNVSTYLSRNSKKRKNQPPRFLNISGGYQLERNAQLELEKSLNTGPARIETSLLMRRLLPKISNPQEETFLQEAIDCYEIGARRAAIVMAWILAIHHLHSYVLKHALGAFNAALSVTQDRRIKIKLITKVDDFSEIPESKFIELCRTAKIISNDARKILDAKLGIRNSFAHPSILSISEVKTTDFIIDLVDNVLLKFVI
jgi:hypothetical protein